MHTDSRIHGKTPEAILEAMPLPLSHLGNPAMDGFIFSSVYLETAPQHGVGRYGEEGSGEGRSL